MPRLSVVGRLALGLALVPVAVGNAGEPERNRHPLHLSHARIVLEGKYVILNIRMFTDDLENALSRFHRIDALSMRADPIVDSLFSDYFNTAFTLVVGDSVIRGAIAESGEAEDMWWYNVVFEAQAVVTAISFRNAVLFDLFDDQRNITRVLHAPSGRQRTYYAVAPHPRTQTFAAETPR